MRVILEIFSGVYGIKNQEIVVGVEGIEPPTSTL